MQTRLLPTVSGCYYTITPKQKVLHRKVPASKPCQRCMHACLHMSGTHLPLIESKLLTSPESPTKIMGTFLPAK